MPGARLRNEAPRLVKCLLLAGTLLWGACEKVDLPVPTAEGNGIPPAADTPAPPIEGTGEGTGTRPYTVADVCGRADELDGSEVWVMGYVVGHAYQSLDNAAFSAEGAKETNVLLAGRPDETDPYACLPVRLQTTRWKQRLGLAQNPDSLRHAVCVLGLVGTYLRTTALTEVSDARWLGPRLPDGGGSPDSGEETAPEPPTDDGPGGGGADDGPNGEQPGTDEPQFLDTLAAGGADSTICGGRAPFRVRTIRLGRTRP